MTNSHWAAQFSPARRLATQGARVFVFGRHDTELNEALGEIRGASGSQEASGITADASRTEDVRRVIREATSGWVVRK